METIQARVSKQLLAKASRLFTGTLDGRIIEILQNARRAGASEVHITNEDGEVTVRDNGRGIDDFARLLDLGASGWEDKLEASEDPAGVGLFCLAPRDTVIRSNGRMARIAGDGWTGAAVEIVVDPHPTTGTLISFEDEPWMLDTVQLHAVFCKLAVTVDGKECQRAPFVSSNAVHDPTLGCRIEVRQSHDLNPWHSSVKRCQQYTANGLVNFHGQCVPFEYHPVSDRYLHFLVDLTGEPTGIRMMLPARTRVVENEAQAQLKAALELEAYRFVHRRGQHRLPFMEYRRAHELGVDLPEATSTYAVGLLGANDPPEPVEVGKPEGFALSKCYRLAAGCVDAKESDEANAHLLAALGKFDEPFVPVAIGKSYNGYSWAELPLIERVELEVGKTLLSTWMWSGTITCVDRIVIKAHTSDGKVFSSPVCMAVAAEPPKEGPTWVDTHVLVTPKAANRVRSSEGWHHLGGWSDEGDSYETQEYQFQEELARFWADLAGPGEHLRQQLLEILKPDRSWRRVIIHADGHVQIQFLNTPQKLLTPPVGG